MTTNDFATYVQASSDWEDERNYVNSFNVEVKPNNGSFGLWMPTQRRWASQLHRTEDGANMWLRHSRAITDYHRGVKLVAVFRDGRVVKVYSRFDMVKAKAEAREERRIFGEGRIRLRYHTPENLAEVSVRSRDW